MPLRPDLEWKKLWDERGQAVFSVLGDTEPPRSVIPFTWEKFQLPGACGLVFPPSPERPQYLTMSLGLTQPAEVGGLSSPWEFCVYTRERSAWALQVIYDLLTHWMTVGGNIDRGCFLPLSFFRNRKGELCGGLSDEVEGNARVGEIRGLYLWPDLNDYRFSPSSGNFGLITAIAVTKDEETKADELTPPHLLLLLKRMGLSQISDPFRKSFLKEAAGVSEWEEVKKLSHDQAVGELGPG